MEHDIKFSKTEEAVAAMLNLEITKDKYEQVCNSEKKSKKEQSRKHTCQFWCHGGCKVSLQKSHTDCRCRKACHYMGRSKRPSNSTEIFYQMRLGSLGKRPSRPKWLNVPGKTLWSYSFWNSSQNLGLLLGVHHTPPTAGVQTRRGQSPQVLHHKHIEETQSDSNSSIFGVSRAA